MKPTDLYRVDHRLHDDQPGEVSSFLWQPYMASDAGITGSGSLDLPNVATQQSLPVYLR